LFFVAAATTKASFSSAKPNVDLIKSLANPFSELRGRICHCYPLYTALLSDWRVSDSSPMA